MDANILAYNTNTLTHANICNLLADTISGTLTEANGKIWHAHPVWFINDNPIVGYSEQKKGIRLMFWSGAGFNDAKLNVRGEKYKDASVFYNNLNEVDTAEIIGWLKQSRVVQWDYKNLVKRKGKLERLF
ncbi:MAG: DUF1801 domain-containing protein [Bacteroidia bacterium]|nr:DUF1801 domain-containing protein [Bacteroidia bacterium]